MNRPPKMPRLMLIGDATPGASPIHTLQRLLTEAGIEVQLAPQSRRPDIWIRSARAVDAIVVIAYELKADLLWRVELAASTGRPVIRWWVGNDVWFVATRPEEAQLARRLDRLVAANIAVAPHLQTSLAKADIAAEVIAIPTHRKPLADVTWSPQIARTVLVYMPSDQADFYGRPVVERLARANPAVTFHVVCDDQRLLGQLANVVCHDFVHDMETLYEQCGCLLRMTEHDGQPRMIVEALAHGRYVIHNQVLPNCLFADSFEEAHAALAQIAQRTEPNMAGRLSAESYDLQREFIDPLLRLVQLARMKPLGRMARALAELPVTVTAALRGNVHGRLSARIPAKLADVASGIASRLRPARKPPR